MWDAEGAKGAEGAEGARKVRRVGAEGAEGVEGAEGAEGTEGAEGHLFGLYLELQLLLQLFTLLRPLLLCLQMVQVCRWAEEDQSAHRRRVR